MPLHFRLARVLLPCTAMTVWKSIAPHRYPRALRLALGLLLLAACGRVPQGEFECETSADCALSFSCIDGTCSRSSASTDGLSGGRDAGMPYAFDAGTGGYDAGSPGQDAGRPDTGRLDTGRPDAGRPDTGTGAWPDAVGPADAGGPCGYAACLVQGAECGQVIDACGTVVDCPSVCRPGFQCGSGAFANRCQCQPRSCSELGAQCGNVTDNCGVSRGCGGCELPERCGGGGVANQCGCRNRETQTMYKVFGTARNRGAPRGTANWADLGNAVQLNGQGADFSVTGSCSAWDNDGCVVGQTREVTTHYLELTNASGPQIPDGATILGIEAQIRVKLVGGAVRIEDLSLIGPRTSDNRANSIAFDDDYVYRTFGGATDLWGRSWTAAELNASSFGMRLQMYASAGCSRGTPRSRGCPLTGAGIDLAQINVHYRVCE